MFCAKYILTSNGKRIRVECDGQKLIGNDVEYVAKCIRNMGFKKIKCKAIKDIYLNAEKYIGEVEQIIVQGSGEFKIGDMVKYDADIVILYHEKKEILIPFSTKSIKKLMHKEVIANLRELGFTNIYEERIEDLITGWVKQDGTIEKVEIAGDCSFKKNAMYKYDEKIVIYYHTFSSKGKGK